MPSSSAAGVPTPGELPRASAVDLRVGQWNMGLPTDKVFSKGNVIDEKLRIAAQRIKTMSDYVHVIGINELHSSFQAQLDKYLGVFAEQVKMVGMTCGDALIWCHAAGRQQ